MPNEKDLPEPLKTLQDAGLNIKEVTLLPDGHAFATGSMPLPKDHWIYGNPDYPDFEPPPMSLKIGQEETLTIIRPGKQTQETLSKGDLSQMLWEAGKYAIRSATMNGSEPDFDPDALIQNLVVGMTGYFTPTGLDFEDDWANPLQYRRKKDA